jgi:hypothetical protein
MAAFGQFAFTGSQRPIAVKGPPEPQHGKDSAPATAWTVPPAGTGQGFSDPQPVDPTMAARGVQRDPSHAYGHHGTPATAAALAPVNGAGAYGSDVHTRTVMQARSAAAHGDRRTVRAQTHAYNPQPQGETGDGQSVDKADGHGGTQISGHAIVKSRPGGAFSDGPAGQFAPTGFRLGVSRRWAARSYTSPALGAMYSGHALRGVLPQIVAKPVNQPALIGVRDSGIGSNARFLPRSFTLPQIWQTPRSEGDLLMSAASAPAPGPVIDTGYMG